MSGAPRCAGAALAGLALLLVPATARAQCTVTPATASGADACQKARDLFAFVTPHVGVALGAGNPVLGESGTLGGLGKLALSARLGAALGYLPSGQVAIAGTGAAVSGDFGAARALVPMPVVDAAIGLVKGVSLGITNVGGVDLLVAGTWLPTVTKGAVSMAPDAGGVGLGGGVRLGILQESAFVPGLSLSYMVRRTPGLDLSYVAGNDTLQLREARVSTRALRLVAGKRLLMFGVAAGVGRDEVAGSAALRATVNESVLGAPQRVAVSLDDLRAPATRNTAFVSASLSLLVARVVAEYGWSDGTRSVTTVNRFGGKAANAAGRYGSIGLAVRF
jgi:hypothetical protein